MISYATVQTAMALSLSDDYDFCLQEVIEVRNRVLALMTSRKLSSGGARSIAFVARNRATSFYTNLCELPIGAKETQIR